MSEREIYNMPQEDLYWKREELKDELHIAKRHMTGRTPKGIYNYYESCVEIITNTIEMINSRMEGSDYFNAIY